MTITLCITTITLCIMTFTLRILSVMCCNTDFSTALCITTGTFCYSAILHCIPHYDSRGAAACSKQITEILAPPSTRCLSVQSTFSPRVQITIWTASASVRGFQVPYLVSTGRWGAAMRSSTKGKTHRCYRMALWCRTRLSAFRVPILTSTFRLRRLGYTCNCFNFSGTTIYCRYSRAIISTIIRAKYTDLEDKLWHSKLPKMHYEFISVVTCACWAVRPVTRS